MKKQLWVGICALLCTVFSAVASSDDDVDYLLLTKENLPAPKVIIEGCLDHLDFDPESFESYKKKQRLSVWLPLVHLGGEYRTNQYSSYGFVDDLQVDMKPGDVVNRSQSYSEFNQNGYNDAWLGDLSLQWDFRELLYTTGTQAMIGAQRNQEQERHFLYVEISKRYGQLWSILPDSSSGRIPRGNAAKIIDHAVVLDAMSGYLISAALKKANGIAITPVVVEGDRPVAVLAPTEQEVKGTSVVIEADDGQDDTVEKAF